eukprot:tig00021073_g18030.t1
MPGRRRILATTLLLCALLLGLLLAYSQRSEADASTVHFRHIQLADAFRVDPLACKNARRYGLDGDGGWTVCVDSFDATDPTLSVLSIGVGWDWSFDRQMGAEGADVISLDHTVTLPEVIAPGVRFFRMGAAARTDLFRSRPMVSLCFVAEQLRAVRGRSLRVVKIDCEGCEWDVLTSALRECGAALLAGVRSLSIEVHMTRELGLAAEADVERAREALGLLLASGFRVASVRKNPIRYGWNSLHPTVHEELRSQLALPHGGASCCLEVTYAR